MIAETEKQFHFSLLLLKIVKCGNSFSLQLIFIIISQSKMGERGGETASASTIRCEKNHSERDEENWNSLCKLILSPKESIRRATRTSWRLKNLFSFSTFFFVFLNYYRWRANSFIQMPICRRREFITVVFVFLYLIEYFTTFIHIETLRVAKRHFFLLFVPPHRTRFSTFFFLLILLIIYGMSHI